MLSRFCETENRPVKKNENKESSGGFYKHRWYRQTLTFGFWLQPAQFCAKGMELEIIPSAALVLLQSWRKNRG